MPSSKTIVSLAPADPAQLRAWEEAGFLCADEPAYSVFEPPELLSPLVFAVPHAGTLYPPSFVANCRLDELTMRSSEDAMVDQLVDHAKALGIPTLACRYGRAVVDMNRDGLEIDPLLVSEQIPLFYRHKSPRVAAGLGVLARHVGEGREIYRAPMTWDEVRARLEGVHLPYHAKLRDLMERVRARHGVAILVDWHSMPAEIALTEQALGRKQPQIVLGDLHGSACTERFRKLMQRLFETEGFSVTINAPFAGGYATRVFGRPRAGFQALQVEMDRGLYFDPTHGAATGDFDGLKARLDRVISGLLSLDLTKALRRAAQ